MAYKQVTALEWGESLEGRRVLRSFARKAGDLTLLTLEVEGGGLADLLQGSRSCGGCGQEVQSQNYFLPSATASSLPEAPSVPRLPEPQTPVIRSPGGRIIGAPVHPKAGDAPPYSYPLSEEEPPIEAYADDPEAYEDPEEDEEGTPESPEDIRPQVTSTRVPQGTIQMTREELSRKLQSFRSLPEMQAWLAQNKPEVID